MENAVTHLSSRSLGSKLHNNLTFLTTTTCYRNYISVGTSELMKVHAFTVSGVSA